MDLFTECDVKAEWLAYDFFFLVPRNLHCDKRVEMKCNTSTQPICAMHVIIYINAFTSSALNPSAQDTPHILQTIEEPFDCNQGNTPCLAFCLGFFLLRSISHSLLF